MDLFTQIDTAKNRAKASDFIEAWAEHIGNDAAAILPDWMDMLYDLHQNKTIYPDFADTFSTFKMIEQPSKVRAVIIGQDPYHNGNANGLAFGCKVNVSPSLKQIVTAIKDNGFPITSISGPSLKYLAEQGVLLLNSQLTVEAGKPDSHAKLFATGWEWFIKGVAKAISRNKPLIVLAWGIAAKNTSRLFEKAAAEAHNPDVYILHNSHPVSATYNRGVWKCDHFKTTNDILTNYNKKEITWL